MKKLKALGRAADFIARIVLAPVEKMLTSSISLKENGLLCPTFIIGPPRSGTTLLYQLLVNRFNFVYMNNLSSRFYTAPTIGIWLTKGIGALVPPKSSGYASHYGKTESIFGPNEAGEFWYRWFPRGEYVYVPPKTTDAKSISELQRQVFGVSKRFGAPMIFKNTYNSMRIAPIKEAFPEAVFLVAQRDPLDVAQSILEGRMRSNRNDWWSVPPKEVGEIKKHPKCEQVVEQVYYIYKQIEEDSRRYGEDDFLYVSYRELCENTYATMEGLQRFLDERGVNVSVKGEIPASFPYSTGKKANDEDFACIRQKVNELWKS